MLWHTFDDNRR